MIKVFYVCSYGGSGSKMLESFLQDYGLVYHMHDPNPPNTLTHATTNPIHPTDVDSFGGEELDLSRYKPYVIFIYSRPECSVWSRCHPTHWLCLQTPRIIVTRLCALMNISFRIVKTNQTAAGILATPVKTEEERQALIEANTYLSTKMKLQDFLTTCLVDLPESTDIWKTNWNMKLIFGGSAANNTEFSKKYFNFPIDYINYENFFKNYTYKRKSYDVLCVNYHNLWENLEFLFNFCEIPLEDIDKFPKQRTPSWEKDPQVALELEKAHDGIFKSLNNIIKQRPSTGVLRKEDQ